MSNILNRIVQRVRPRPCQWVWVNVTVRGRVHRVRQCVVHRGPLPPTINPPGSTTFPSPSGNGLPGPIPILNYPPKGGGVSGDAMPPPAPGGMPFCPVGSQAVMNSKGQWQCVPIGGVGNPPSSGDVNPKISPTMNNTMSLSKIFHAVFF